MGQKNTQPTMSELDQFCADKFKTAHNAIVDIFEAWIASRPKRERELIESMISQGTHKIVSELEFANGPVHTLKFFLTNDTEDRLLTEFTGKERTGH